MSVSRERKAVLKECEACFRRFPVLVEVRTKKSRKNLCGICAALHIGTLQDHDIPYESEAI